MRMVISRFVVLALATAAATAGAQDGPLRSPWDGRKVMLTDAAYVPGAYASFSTRK
jgi:hypothetical protein